ncbi:DUF5522 domain-containing protein [Flavihumibacter sp. CACIAM 22H1]|uniref:DUF5522 domain-containing protein n=1 Tax=Flavihumibacter sp. CACIAM 22H1 TaxID=1812911 RepID=UPI0007A7FDC6|nr:DUF5522 domain-containing protein [Flavihumibacter sp. CACIAM 22H1]KYP13101.1 MAG: hypothetical protein A1D16_11870 [Flavihumibacter sp. CACIAM 22H1]
MKKQLIEGEDFYYNESGFVVLTSKYHLEKGFCCGNGCLHCPFDYINVPEPRRSQLRLTGKQPYGKSAEEKN